MYSPSKMTIYAKRLDGFLQDYVLNMEDQKGTVFPSCVITQQNRCPVGNVPDC